MAAFQFPKIRVAILNAKTPSRKAAKITLDYTFVVEMVEITYQTVEAWLFVAIA
jgi:hypothetical protein